MWCSVTFSSLLAAKNQAPEPICCHARIWFPPVNDSMHVPKMWLPRASKGDKDIREKQKQKQRKAETHSSGVYTSR